MWSSVLLILVVLVAAGLLWASEARLPKILARGPCRRDAGTGYSQSGTTTRCCRDSLVWRDDIERLSGVCHTSGGLLKVALLTGRHAREPIG